MAMQQFQTESKRILDLMIHSIYTHKEIFLRELISNASDAIDKLYYRALQDGTTGMNRDEFSIALSIDKAARTLTVTDNGCGMTEKELTENLGVIAQSGTLGFKQEHTDQEDMEMIGQFGVGFYSAFMVAKKITVKTRAYGSDQAFLWESEGAEGFTISPCEMEGFGTQIVLTMRDNTDEEDYDQFLDQYRISSIVTKYSDYIRYPIRLAMEKSRKKEGSENEYETYTEIETLNSMVPLWKRSKQELTQDDYNAFYSDKFHDSQKPLSSVHTSAEGSVSYQALLFVPATAPYNYYTRDYEKGLQLYTNGVLIMDKCADLLPDYFSFVKGLVDSQDLSLNISRELLQHDRQLKIIAKNIEKKIANELAQMLKNRREDYETFFSSFGLQLKYGVYQDFGMHKDVLQDLLLFRSMEQEKLVTLREYVDAMKEDQKCIYYACGENLARILQMPQLELLKEKGYDVLLLTDDVDEFAMRALYNYDNKEFKSIADADLDLSTDEEKDSAKKQNEEHEGMLQLMLDSLGEQVKSVRVSTRLKTHPVCLSADGAISLEMEKVLNAMPNANPVRAERVLELNPTHPVFATLTRLYEQDQEKLRQYASLLYTQALLIEGILPEDPAAYANMVCELMTK